MEASDCLLLVLLMASDLHFLESDISLSLLFEIFEIGLIFLREIVPVDCPFVEV